MTARRGVASLVLVAGLALAGCGGAGGGSTAAGGDGMPEVLLGTGQADRGDLHVRDAYIPRQASPDVAAAYFSVTNDGPVADRLVRVTTPAAPSVGLHTTVTHGGASTMRALRALEIPAGGTALLSVGGRHLMLMNPVRPLTEGETVPLTLWFARGGEVVVRVPVVGFTGPDAGGAHDH